MKDFYLIITFYIVFCFYWRETEADGTHEGIEDPDTYRNIDLNLAESSYRSSNMSFTASFSRQNIDTEIIVSEGYPVEEHTVQTDDGYLLSVVRIPHGRKNNLNGNQKKVILLIHGIVGDANTWLLDFPGKSLGFVLPDEGYDVWMLSTRGSYYSLKHIKYNKYQRQFWNFSFHEVGNYDIPSTIDYILKVTGKEALYIVAYSQGSTGSLIMLSDKPSYNDKVKLFIALAPVSFIGYSTSAYRPFVPFKYTLVFFNDLFTHGAFFPDNQILKVLRAKFCSMTGLELCESILFAFGGVDRAQLNETRIDVYASRFPSSTSSKSLLHYGQLVQSKKFRKYDYGRHRNLKYYQQKEPPDYETSRITVPTALIWSSNDKIADPTDVDLLRQTLRPSTLVFDYQVPYPYNHFDYCLAENAPKLINEPVLQLLAQY